MSADPRIILLKYLTDSGFRRMDERWDYLDKSAGDRHLRVNLIDEEWAGPPWVLLSAPAASSARRGVTHFSTLEELEIALIYETLRDRSEPWPMTLASP